VSDETTSVSDLMHQLEACFHQMDAEGLDDDYSYLSDAIGRARREWQYNDLVKRRVLRESEWA
jgi:hypothetical protein